MRKLCACGKDYSDQPSFSKHGKKCQIYQQRKVNRQELDLNSIKTLKTETHNHINTQNIIENQINNSIDTQNNIENQNNTDITNIYKITNINLPYLHPFSKTKYDMYYNDKLFQDYIDNHEEQGMSCCIKYLFNDNSFRNIKWENESEYKVYDINRNSSKKNDPENLFHSPPKWRKYDQDLVNDEILKKITDVLGEHFKERIRYSKDIETINKIGLYQRKWVEEKEKNAGPLRQKKIDNLFIKTIQRIAKENAMIKYKFDDDKKIYCPYDYDSDTLSV